MTRIFDMVLCVLCVDAGTALIRCLLWVDGLRACLWSGHMPPGIGGTQPVAALSTSTLQWVEEGLEGA